MENFKRLQSLALKIILFLVWFDLMCFALILAGTVFEWSFLNESVSAAFFATFGLSLGALIALVLLHVVLTLNIISNSISHIAKDKEIIDPALIQKNKKRFRNIIVISIITIILAVGYQGFVEFKAAKHKVKKVENNLKDVAKSTLSTRIVDLIERDEKINELYFVRDELLLSLEEERRSVTLLVPKMGQTGQVFYEITPWDYDHKDETAISKSLRNLFIPKDNERKKFKNLVEKNKPFTVVNRYNIRAFYPITKKGELKVILLLDTGRSVSNAYLMSRAKIR